MSGTNILLYPHLMLSNFGSNSTVSFRFGSLPFKCHLIFLFYLPFSLSSYFSLLLFHPLLTSHFHFSHLVASLFSLLFVLGCILATAILIKKGWEGHHCCQGYQYFLLSLEEVSCAPIIMELDAQTHSFLLCLSPQYPQIMREPSTSKRFYQTVSLCHGCHHLVRNYLLAQMFIEKFRETQNGNG